MSNYNCSVAMATIIYACIILTISLWEMPHVFSPPIQTKCNLEKLSTFLVIVTVYHLFVNGILVLVLFIVASHLKFLFLFYLS